MLARQATEKVLSRPLTDSENDESYDCRDLDDREDKLCLSVTFDAKQIYAYLETKSVQLKR